MKIVKIVSQHRRDYTALMKCESCGHTEMDNGGYDDNYYHTNVIPLMTCSKCNESTKSLGGTPNDTRTKYPEGYQI